MSTDRRISSPIGTRHETRTVREELAEHEGVVGLGVVLRELDVLVHVEGHDMLEASDGSMSVFERPQKDA